MHSEGHEMFEHRCAALIEELHLGKAADVRDVTALTGGVASDIASVRVGDKRYCVKFALPKLKVASDWYAPVQRNAAEYAWLEVAADVLPGCAVRLFGRSEQLHGFVMEFVEGDDVYLWKSALLSGRPPQGEAGIVGGSLGRVHAVSTRPEFNTTQFCNRDDFRALRIEPYLAFTAGIHPAVGAELKALARSLYRSAEVLVHGDVSPKNILIRQGAPVILDAECATMGDPAFDSSFCLNHLLLKAMHVPALRDELFVAVDQFWEAYRSHIAWEDPAAVEARICALLPALMLARIDGKSPVEYLSEACRREVREVALSLIRQPVSTLADYMGDLKPRLEELRT